MEQAIDNLRQRVLDAVNRLGLPVFWRWWTSTLAPMMPAKSRTAVQRRRLRPVIAFGDGVAVVWELRVVDASLTLAEVARIPLAGDPAAVAHAGRTALASLPAQAAGFGGGSGVKVFLALPPAQVLRKRLTLPAAVDEHLKDALAFDLDRHTPFRPDQLYFDAVIVARDPAKKEITVDWAAALRTVVDVARRHAESFGATVVGVTPEPLEAAAGAPPAPAAWSKLNLLPQEERPDTRTWRRPQVWMPAALLVAMLLVAVILPIWQKRDYVMALNETTEQARAQAATADALRQQLDRATGDYNFALGKKYGYPSTVQILDDVTRLLPDDTWLTQMEVKSMPKGKEPHREMLLRGESANAGRLISALEDSKMFEQAAPRSPTTKIQPGPGEVFDLGAQLKALPPPEPIKLVAALPAAKPAAPPAAAPPAAAPPPAVAPAASKDAPAAVAAPAPAPPSARPAAPPMAAGSPAGAEPPPALPQGGMSGTPIPRQGAAGAPRPPIPPAGALAVPPRGPLSAPGAPASQPGAAAFRPQLPPGVAPVAEGQAVPATAPGSGPAMSPGNAPAAEEPEPASGANATTAPLATSGAAAAKGVIARPKGEAR